MAHAAHAHTTPSTTTAFPRPRRLVSPAWVEAECEELMIAIAQLCEVQIAKVRLLDACVDERDTHHPTAAALRADIRQIDRDVAEAEAQMARLRSLVALA